MPESPTSMTPAAKVDAVYWDGLWRDSDLPPVRRQEVDSLRNHSLHEIHLYLTEQMGRLPRGGAAIEFGCAQSLWLPYLGRVHGLLPAGVDYSAEGCRKAEAVLAREGLTGDVREADFAQPPADFIGRFDLGISFGVVEHFEETAQGLAAFMPYLRPGGRLITIIPNMTGLPGALQRGLNRPVFDIHTPLTADALADAHRRAGLEVLDARWLVPVNLGVILPRTGDRLGQTLRHLLMGASLAAWAVDRVFRLPRTGSFAAYVACAARKPDAPR